MTGPPASVVICTHDRGAVVRTALAGALREARTVGAEVIAVDNACTDDTPAILAEVAATAGGQLRVVHEPRLGLSAARNRGLAAARGPVVVYLDDDADPRPGWLPALLAAFDDPHVGAAGGCIRLRFTVPAPAWLGPALHPALSAFDAGAAPRALRYGHDDYPYGANLAVRTAPTRRLGGFAERLGAQGRRPSAHEEIDLCYRLEAAGHEVRWVPTAVVDHLVPAGRLTPAWFLRRARGNGESAALFVLRNRGAARAVWRVWWLYRRALATWPYQVAADVDGARLARECRRQEALGYLRGLVRWLPHTRMLRRPAAPLAADPDVALPTAVPA